MIKESVSVVTGIEAQYCALIEAMPGVAHLFNADAPRFTILASTPQMFKMTGTTKDGVIGRGVFEAFPSNPADLNDTGESNLRASLLYVLDNKQSHQLPIQRYDLIDDQGKFVERYWRAENNPILSPAGEVLYILHTAEDITDQVESKKIQEEHLELERAYKKAEESQQRFYSLANSITQLAWIADDAGWIFWYNDRWYEYTGTDLEEMEGWGWEKVHHPDHIERVVSFVKEAWQKTEPWELIFPLRRHDGEYRWFLTRGVPVTDKNGKVIQWIGTNTDIDDQKQAEVLLEQRVQERTRELQMRNRELEQFTHVSHHDLQEPLRKIAIYTDMIKAEAVEKLSNESWSKFQKISEAAQRMSTALRDVLDFASLSKAEKLVAVDLNEVLAGVQNDLELVISERQATIKSDTLPTLNAAPTQMHQLLFNLINNALKFSKPSTPPHIIITSTEQQAALVEHQDLDRSKKYCTITVQDDGIGFDQLYADKIFDMFQRLHTKAAFSGTGIGLALCKKVVLNHQGKIWAKSREGEGATFYMVLPVT
jgi:PAS domain S-box-containing protein